MRGILSLKRGKFFYSILFPRFAKKSSRKLKKTAKKAVKTVFEEEKTPDDEGNEAGMPISSSASCAHTQVSVKSGSF